MATPNPIGVGDAPHEGVTTPPLRPLPVGKLHPDLLSRLLRFKGWPDERVMIGPAIGQDAAVIDLGDRYLVAKSDPITFASQDIGWYLVQVNANDLATTGATPRWLLVTLLLPEAATTPEMAQGIMEQIDAACRELRIAVVGGHTEVTHGLPRPIVVGHLLGEVQKDHLVTTAGAKVGDDLLLVKGIAIEGTSIIARERGAELLERGYSERLVQRARRYLHDPGISVVREARLAIETGGVHAMHDPTEGGLVTGLHEMAQAAQVGLWIDREAVPILPESAALCAEFGLDPLGTIASGALLVAASHDKTPELESAFSKAQVPCATIGAVTPQALGLKMKSGAATMALPRFDQDEITRLFC